jgi:amino acid transporter
MAVQTQARPSGMGTFGGVFTPSILTILGLVLFLRLGYVVGTVGLGQALLIVALASLVSILTSISLAAVATNLEVKSGGVYYIISRTLGPAFGGAIGLVLFVALAVSVGFYCVGFAEGVAGTLGLQSGLVSSGFAAAAVVLVTAIAWFGAEWATRVQYIVMAFLVAALISFSVGAVEGWSLPQLSRSFAPMDGWAGFWPAFAIFFPAVTGFTQGVNMSGDLADPVRSIPRGTTLAVGLSILVYLAAEVLLAGAVPRGTLLADYGAMRKAAAFAPLIDAGIIAATLSSALASLMGAPRILQSLAKDQVFPFLSPFAKGEGRGGNPRRGVLLGGALALGTVALGNLNLIASVVAMFFVVTYGLLNYATYYEARARSPSFRPALRWFDPRISLVGGLVCLGVMLAINLVAGLVAIAVVFAIFQYLTRNATGPRWADGQRSYHLQSARGHLLAAAARPEHARDWRPQILAFSNDSERRERLLTFANWIEGRSGLTTVVRILEGSGRRARRELAAAERELAADLEAKGLMAFPLVVSAFDLDSAVPVVVQSAGIGPTRVNTVLLNWLDPSRHSGDTQRERRFLANLHSVFLLGYNLLVFDAQKLDWERLSGTKGSDRLIDVWWLDNPTGRLMLVLAYLLTRSDAWHGATVRLLVPSSGQEPPEQLQAKLEAILQEVRIAAEVVVLDQQGDLTDQSKSSSIVFMGLGIRAHKFTDWHGSALEEVLPSLPIVVLTMAAEELDLSADPDEPAAPQLNA